MSTTPLESARRENVGRALARAADATEPCALIGVTSITADQLDTDDHGALEPDETGWVGHCACGHRSRVRYSASSAQSAIAEHVLGRPVDPFASRVGTTSRDVTSCAVRPPGPAQDAPSPETSVR